MQRFSRPQYTLIGRAFRFDAARADPQCLETERLMLESGVFWRAVRAMPLNENAIVIGL
jgi:hypothetical protein